MNSDIQSNDEETGEQPSIQTRAAKAKAGKAVSNPGSTEADNSTSDLEAQREKKKRRGIEPSKVAPPSLANSKFLASFTIIHFLHFFSYKKLERVIKAEQAEVGDLGPLLTKKWKRTYLKSRQLL